MPLRLLLVDDETALLPLLKRALERDGFATDTAASGEAALRWVDANGTPDVLIADLTLPGLSGVELAVELMSRFAELRVLLCSGYAVEVTVFPASLRARTAVLQKPFSPPALAEAVRRLLASGNPPAA